MRFLKEMKKLKFKQLLKSFSRNLIIFTIAVAFFGWICYNIGYDKATVEMAAEIRENLRLADKMIEVYAIKTPQVYAILEYWDMLADSTQ